MADVHTVLHHHKHTHDNHQAPSGTLVEPIVPVSVSCQCLDFVTLTRLVDGIPDQPGYVKVGLVDSDGTVTISKLHVGVQMPEEKLLADDDGGGE